MYYKFDSSMSTGAASAVLWVLLAMLMLVGMFAGVRKLTKK
jgi:hypothetical protein